MIFIWIRKNHMDPFERPCFTYTDSIYILAQLSDENLHMWCGENLLLLQFAVR